MLRRKVPVPLYHQLELQLRAAIEEGRFRPGDQLPTEAALQQEYGVSRVTVRTALKRLEEDSVLPCIESLPRPYLVRISTRPVFGARGGSRNKVFGAVFTP